ncbi:hypothetical protein KY363_00160 [Candidatus Woesearchaeota archaeon]|nr:hypothetical protein [Candidatus Woesearchaeota archaeon]
MEQDIAKVIESVKEAGSPLYILGHTGFCYDAIGSAFGLAHLCGKLGLEAKVCGEFSQDWGYPQNNILYNQLALAERIVGPSDVPNNASLAYVDVFPCGTNCYALEGRRCMVINHHPVEDSREPLDSIPFVDTRPAGSTVALIVDHMMKSGIELTDADRNLATLMLYGLRMDTKHYLKGKELELDFEASKFLAPFADLDAIQKIESKRYPVEILNIMRKMDEKSVGKYRVGVAKVTKPGMVPQLADVLGRFEGCPISMVLAKVEEGGEKEWYVSGRSSNAAYNVGELIKELFGTGGGHWYAGGASMTTTEVYRQFKVDESKNRSVLKQIMSALEARLKKISNE